MSFGQYPSYRESGAEWLGHVPAHWGIERLKRLCDVRPSNVDKKSYDDEVAVRLCNYTDVYYQEQITASMELMAATATEEQIERFSLRAGDVIITKDSETPDDIAIAAYVPENLPLVVCGYHLALLRCGEAADGAFLKRYFDSGFAKASVEVRANGLTRVGLGQYALDNLLVPTPPPAEQSAIAAFLDRETGKIDALVEEQRRLIALLKEKRQAVISHAVTKGLDPSASMKPSGVEWLGDVPAHWEVRSMGTLATVVRGASPRPAGDPRYFDGDHMPWVTVGEITKGGESDLTETESHLTAEGAMLSRIFKSGTLIYSNSGATLGVPKILRMEACANDGVVGFERLSTIVDIYFAYFFLVSLTDIIRDMVKQGAGQPNLNTDIVKSIMIALPPKGEQAKIVEVISSSERQFLELGAEAESAITLLQERRAALVSAAVTGKIDVRGAVPAEAEAA